MEQIIKYAFYISVVLNGILLMVVTGILPFLLYLSVLVNLVLVWYSLKSLHKLNDIEEDMVFLMERNELFLENLEQIHSLEMYYGDQDLQSLIDHSRELVNEYIDIQEKYFEVEVTSEEDEEQLEEEGQIEEDTTTPEN
jgi:hypothetical protein